MKLTKQVKEILSCYESDNPGTRRNLTNILMHGKLGGTGKMLILPVDQGFEHGPVRSFASNPDSYDPNYHFQLAIDAGLSAYAAPLGMLEMGAHAYSGSIPMIIKMNSSNALDSKVNGPSQAITAKVEDAIRLGCVGIGFTIYPGAENAFTMMEEIKELAAEAKSYGLAVIIWSYPRGGHLSKKGETAIDVTAYAAHMAALLGAHIIKVKPPTDFIEQQEAKEVYESEQIPISTLAERVAHIKDACFAGKRLVVFSGGSSKSTKDLYTEIEEMHAGGSNGSIIGRNTFQRPREEALEMLQDIVSIYLNKK
jgi:fructose-bisphosphate aldolase, class I